MTTRIAIAHLADSRTDFYTRREPLVFEELKALYWLRKAQIEVLESEIIMSNQGVDAFARQVIEAQAQSLVIHLPIWADPIFSVRLYNALKLPALLLGNDRPDTSSTVSVLGAGGALDQVGHPHVRIFEHTSPEARQKVLAFINAAAACSNLRGKILGLFGGRSLGIFTTVADPAQWQRLFGVDIVLVDQLEIVETANQLAPEEVKQHLDWLLGQVGQVTYGERFNPQALERQVRSYIATRQLIQKYQFDFVGVKCQPELSDGYVTQCVSHMLTNGVLDADGAKKAVVHACESDADGALTMQIMNLLSGGKPTALLDVRWYDRKRGTWTLANCGAMAAAFYATKDDPSGLSNVRVVPHVFGRGGGALPALVTSQPVTLARMCRKDGKYWMAIVRGQLEERSLEEMNLTTGAFPQAFLHTTAGMGFADKFGSNHIHMVSGEYSAELEIFCKLVGIDWQTWE